MILFINKQIRYSFLTIFFVFFSSLASSREKREVKIKEIKRSKRVTLKEAQMLSQREIMIENPLEEELIDEIDHALHQLMELSSKLKKGSLARAKIVNKIINLSLEQAGYITSQEHRSFDTIWSDWYEGGKRGKEPLFSSVDSKKYYKLVIKFTDKYLKEFPENENRVFVYFQKAVSLQYLDKYSEAISVFMEIIQEYPDSEVASEAYFEVGSFYFDRDKNSLAKENFKKVLGFKNATRIDWSLYKLGWIYFNQGNYVKSLKYWEKTVSLTSQKEKKSGTENLLKKQVLKDMIYVFSELGNINYAVKYFEEHGKKDNISRFLFYLAQTYFEQGKRNKAERSYLKLLEEQPNSKEAVKAQFELALISYEKKQFNDLWSRLIFWHKNYGANSKWAELNRDDEVEENLTKTEETLLYYAQKLQIEAGKKSFRISESYTSPRNLYLQSRKGYEYYLQLYPESVRFAEILEYLGDVSYALSDYEESASAYEAIVKMPKEEAVIYDSSGKVAENIHFRSATNMLDSASKHFASYYKKMIEKNPDFEKKPKELSKEAEIFIQSCSLFQKFYKEEDLKKKCDFFSSEIFYRNGDKKKAKKYLKYIALNYRNDPEGALALDKLIPLYEGSPKKQADLAREFLKLKAYSQAEIGQKLRLLVRSVDLKEITQSSSAIEKARLFEAYAKEHPKDEEVESLWYNAAVAYFSAESLKNAVRVLKLIMEKYPKFEKRDAILIQLAQIHETLLLFDKSVDYYFLYTRLFPKGKQIIAAKQRSCTLAYVSGDSNLISLCSTFAKDLGEEAKETILKLMNFSFYANNTELYTQLLYSVYFKYFSISENEKILALHNLYKIYPKNSDLASSFGAKIKRIPFSKKITGEALRFYANFYYQDFSRNLSKIEFVKSQPKTVLELQTLIQSNLTLLKNGEALSSKVLSFKDAYSTAKVYYDLFFLYKKMDFVLQSNFTIEGYSKEQIDKDLELVRESISNQVKSYFSNAETIVHNFKILDDDILEIEEKVARLEGEQYPGRWVPPLNFISLDGEESFFNGLFLRSE